MSTPDNAPMYSDYLNALRVLDELRPIAMEIAQEISRRAVWAVEFDDPERISYTFNDACNCHPEEGRDSFPASWLFDPAWRESWAEIRDRAVRERIAETAAKTHAEAVARETKERALLQHLKSRYEHPGAGA